MIAFGLVQWLSMKIQGGFSEDGWYFRYVLPVMAWGVGGWLYAWIACSVAPRGKVIAGTVMTTLLILVTTMLAAWAWTLATFSVSQFIFLTIQSIVTWAAAIAAIVYVHNDLKVESKPCISDGVN